MHQPISIVVRYRGISNGKNITSGIKNYLILNRKKFIKKCKNELQFQAFKGNNNSLARDRGFNKSRIFMVDNSALNLNKNSLDRCSFMYLEVFKEIGLLITFLGDDLQLLEHYTTDLQQKGIEVLYGQQYKGKNWKFS